MIFVAIGGFFGSIVRFSLSQWIKAKLQSPSYFATFFINCVGSFLLGLTFGIGLNQSTEQLLAIGFLGAFTTFSTFSFEVIQLLDNRSYKTALSYLFLSIFFGMVLATIGFSISYFY